MTRTQMPPHEAAEALRQSLADIDERIRQTTEDLAVLEADRKTIASALDILADLRSQPTTRQAGRVRPQAAAPTRRKRACHMHDDVTGLSIDFETLRACEDFIGCKPNSLSPRLRKAGDATIMVNGRFEVHAIDHVDPQLAPSKALTGFEYVDEERGITYTDIMAAAAACGKAPIDLVQDT